MPTVVVLDLSLSMLRPACPNSEPPKFKEDDDEVMLVEDAQETTLLDLATSGIEAFLTHLEKQFKMEYVSIIGFSSQCELLCGFSRDFQEMKEKLRMVETSDSTNILSALKSVVSYIHEQWSNSVHVDILIVTDEGLGHGPLSLNRIVCGPSDPEIFPFKFPGSLTVMCLGNPDSSGFKAAKSAYEKLISLAKVDGKVLVPEPSKKNRAEIDASAVQRMFQNYFTSHYHPFFCTLKLGDELSSRVTLYPPPSSFKTTLDFSVVEAELEEVFEIKGFISISDASSPPVFSRHLVLPHIEKEESQEDESRIPSLCVFLHGALKVENMCALVQMASDKTSSINWFGILYSCADSKKKSNLMLSLFEPGNTPVPWLGDLRRLGPKDDLNETSSSPFPVKASMIKPSYSSSPVVWTKDASLHIDVQKILRNARKLPDKTPHFYKELNRLKRAALSLGFLELLEGVATVLDRERAALSSSSHPESSVHLSHAAMELRSRDGLKLDYQIHPPPQSKFYNKRE